MTLVPVCCFYEDCLRRLAANQEPAIDFVGSKRQSPLNALLNMELRVDFTDDNSLERSAPFLHRIYPLQDQCEQEMTLAFGGGKKKSYVLSMTRQNLSAILTDERAVSKKITNFLAFDLFYSIWGTRVRSPFQWYLTYNLLTVCTSGSSIYPVTDWTKKPFSPGSDWFYSWRDWRSFGVNSHKTDLESSLVQISQWSPPLFLQAVETTAQYSHVLPVINYINILYHNH